MTISSGYIPEGFNPNPSRRYTFTFQHLGAETIKVQYVYFDGTDYTQVPVDPAVVTINLGVSEAGVYSGGEVFISELLPDPSIVSISVSRQTPITQLVDYQPYTPFPAEVTEYALDKQTLIDQELNFNIGVSGGGGGGTPAQDIFVPLAGTFGGLPITGKLEFTRQNGYTWNMDQGNLFGVNAMVVTGENVNSAFYINTKDSSGDPKQFTFTQDGQLYIPSFEPGNNEVWVFQGTDFLGTENALGVYSFDQNTNLRTSNPIILYTTETESFFFGENGKSVQTGVVTAGDPDQTVATKKYVDDAVTGGGGLPPDAAGDLLVGSGTGWIAANDISLGQTPGDAELTIKGSVIFDNIDAGAGTATITMRDGFGAEYLTLSGDGINTSGVAISPDGWLAGNEFFFSNGFLILPKDPTSASHAVTKQYVDTNFVNLTTNQTVAGEKTFTDTVRGVGLDFTGQGGFESVACDNLQAFSGNVLRAGPFGLIEASGFDFGDVVLTTGNQTIGGEKTFTGTVRGVGLDFTGQGGFESVACDLLQASPGQILRAGPLGLIEATGVEIADLVQTTGNQTIAGEKTFSNTVRGVGLDFTGQGGFESVALDNLAAASGQILTAGALGLVQPSGLNFTNLVQTTSNQTISGTKTFTGLIRSNTLSVGNVSGDPNGSTYSAVFNRTIAVENVPSATGGTAVWNFGFLGVSSSDISLKRDIVPTRLSGLDTVMSGEVVDFKWKSSGESDVGFIAQQMREFVPEAFPTNPDGKLGIRELPLLAALWKAVQELNNKVEALTNESTS